MHALSALCLSVSPIMAALMGVSVIALAVILERAWSWVRARTRLSDPQALLDLAGKAEGVDDADPRAPQQGSFGRVLQEWRASQGHRGTVEQAIELEETLLDRNLWMLDCAATIGPLLGILGTLLGLAQSFRGFDAITKIDPTLVARGISLALNTTVVGLSVTVASVVCAHLYRRMADRAAGEMERFTEALLSIRER